MPSANVEQQPSALAAREPRTDMKELAAAITQAVQATQYQQPMKHSELPCFNGDHQDWLTFRAAYCETAYRLTAVENMSRLRRSLRGIAKEAVQGLLIVNADPNEVMKTLELRFGRPDSIAIAEMERLRTLPRLTESPREVCTFATKVENIVGTLRALNCGHYLYNPEVTKTIVEKLTPTLKRQWYQFSAAQPRTEPDLLKFTRFIKLEAEICSPYASPENIAATARTNQNTQRRQQRVHTTQETSKPKCSLCERQGHNVIECEQFKKAATDARWDIAKKHRLCFRCLKYRTKQHSCKPKKCEINDCVHFHHRMLHASSTTNKKKEETECSKDEQEKVHSAWTPKVSSFLKIIPVQLSGPAGAVDTYALLDDGSTVTLIDENLANQIGAEGSHEPLRIASFDGEPTVDVTSRRVNFHIKGLHTSERNLRARTIKQLELAAQRIPRAAVQDCEHLRDITRDIVTEDARPKLLIGQDNWDLLIATKVRTGKKNQPVASLTPLGWVLHGSHTRALGHRVNFIRHANTDDDLHDLVKEYITMDNMEVKPKKPFNDPEEKALRILQQHTKRTPEGKYQTALLWREENVKMPDNYDSALNRLIGVEKKIDKDPELKKRYSEQMEALVSKGYAEPAPPTTLKHRTWYLPHFAVINPMKPDKLRIVCDAAAKTRGVSLNDQLLTGPDLLQSLPGVIMRFRQHSIAVTADITEMFLQIELRPEDRDSLRYLWRGDRRDDQPPEQYRMKSLIFGASCSPTTAIYVKNTNAERFQSEHPKAVEAIVRKHYMDDYLNSFETLEEAVEISQAIRDIHKEANFELKKWSSNATALLEALGEVSRTKETIKLENSIDTERVLGLIWKPNEDSLAFNLNLARIPQKILQNDTPTKREALRIVMSLFDPLGLVSPVTIRAKQILQEVWRRGIAWDEALDSDLATSWRKWLTHLKRVENISIPRTYPGFSATESLQLHVFTDASESAYTTALYWRTVTGDGRVDVCLVTAKAKVAPLKLMSIPRLELQAAVLGARMASAVKTEHERTPESTTFWTDSRTTLSWIRTGSRSYRPFVAHRIAAIEEHSATNEWRWLPTKLNPADDATRDVPENYDQDHRWFNGPEFLLGPPETWPADEKSPIIITGEERTCSVFNKDKNTQTKEAIPDVDRFSRWERYLRATARVLQFLRLCRQSTQDIHYKRTKRNSSTDSDWKKNKRTLPAKTRERQGTTITNNHLPLTAELLRNAESLILRASQEQSFQEEIEAMKNERTIPRNSRLHALCIELVEGEIRLKSRIANMADITDTMKKPMVLDGDHPTTRLWIEHVHRRLHHSGVETTVNECRQQFWVLRLRPTVKNIISKCLRCRIKAASPPQPMTGNLPSCRLAHHQRPFTFAGLDYFGPLTITVGRSHQKRYVALFTCLTTRAVHLELVASLNTDSAIMALRRMIARRGCPAQLWSDNGTNFHGAERELRDAIFAATAEEASKKMIDWRFIPPGAPFMGGAWERMVKSVKTALAVTLNEQFPSEEVLHTLLIEAEHTVNSRPLTHVSVNVEDPEALTPNHFLLGGSGRLTSPGEFDDSDLRLRASWRAAQRLADIFWARWLKEYLPDLQNRREPHTKGTIPKIGDMILIVDGNLPRNMWIRGRICATFPGPDGVVRTVDVTTKGGILRRPVKKIIVLPIKSGDPAPCSATASSAADNARREECAGHPRTIHTTTVNIE